MTTPAHNPSTIWLLLMNPLRLLPLVLLLVPPATAKPIALICKIPDEGRVLVHEFSLDEANQTVTRSVGGSVDRFPALFTSTAVNWTWAIPVAMTSFSYSLSRTDGRLFTAVNGGTFKPSGTCSKAAPTKRLF